MTSITSTPADDVARQTALRERHRNLLIDAGAGTGKTTLIVHRLLAMVAPRDNGTAYPLERVAAITFTRRAAGELRLRVREEILLALAEPHIADIRRDRLLAALGQLDTAFIGTIHGFADRLLRMYPVEAKVSPIYEIAEDEDELAQEAYLEMLQAAQTGTLATRFASSNLKARAEEVQHTLVEAVQSRLRAQTDASDFYVKLGLDSLVARLIGTRDCPVDLPAPRFDHDGFQRATDEYLRLVQPLAPESKGEIWMVRFGSRLRAARTSKDPRVLLDLAHRVDDACSQLKKTIDFPKGPSRDAWVTFQNGLADDLTGPIKRWMAHRLVRMRPIAEAIYEEVKLRYRNVDSIDLLLKLARLLRSNLQVRGEYQQMFDHIFVDEVQDTDLLQVEVILFLSELKPLAKKWNDVVVGPGRLTLVGDPKQSIYRFRRADIAMYESLTTHLKQTPDTVAISLTTNFRSIGSLVDWYNERFTKVLGGDDGTIDPATGRVSYKPLSPHRDGRKRKSVHVLPFALAQGSTLYAADHRELEGEAIAQYVRSLLKDSSLKAMLGRTPRFRDIAVLAITTTQLRHLFAAFDRFSVPYAASGGSLFLRDPLQRQFLLGLRALADPDDGVAEAAILRPPFFSIDLWDVIQSRAPEGATVDAYAAQRGLAARAVISELRKGRFARSPGTTARKLIEETSFGALTATGPNGEQRMRQLYELCTYLDQRAMRDGLDFDQLSVIARSWVEWPTQLEPSRPLWNDAVQVMSVHQAKGLEFPVVVLWDGCAQWRAADRPPCFVTNTATTEWAVNLDGLKWQEPNTTGVLEREKDQADAERRRIVYVAATRARELLVVPHAAGSKFDNNEQYVNAMLAHAPDDLAYMADTYRREKLPGWVVSVKSPAELRCDVVFENEVTRHWSESTETSKRPYLEPVGVTTRAKSPLEADPDAAPVPRREGRFGPLFGEAVHRALGLVITRKLPASTALERSARSLLLTEHLDEAVADVERGLATLRRESLLEAQQVRVEYPVGAAEAASLMTGFIDLLILDGNVCSVIDFKTDRAPTSSAYETHPGYVRQLAAYERMLKPTLPEISFRRGLLWTETGRLEWLEKPTGEACI